ncbi:MAG: site-specific DNA-methyltransferase [Bacteroidetes bacterium]|nr:site-specific DNA-methyltransferase [Bacteroidota bacterium]
MQIITDYLVNFELNKDIASNVELFNNYDLNNKTRVEYFRRGNANIPKYINEYWTAKQRQANSIHEISYRACFKPQLPRFFISLLTKENDIVFDPFSGRGTTAIESALLNRRFIANDVNPLSIILAKPRTKPPIINEIIERIESIDFAEKLDCDIDLSMFYYQDTLNEILNLKSYLINRKQENKEDYIDEWIRMVATNRLTGHSKGFFSVFTLPPNQAVSSESQKKINVKRNQIPEYRNVKEIIINKSKNLLKDIDNKIREQLFEIARQSYYFNKDARSINEIKDDTVSLTITSPPFLNIVQYGQDNWLRCWFNSLDAESISKQIVMAKTTNDWSNFIENVFNELFRITKKEGHIAFEVGEVSNGKVNLEEYVVDVGIKVGLECLGILINTQEFTKTSNIWGINNNNNGTNSNRIVLFKKNRK